MFVQNTVGIATIARFVNRDDVSVNRNVRIWNVVMTDAAEPAAHVKRMRLVFQAVATVFQAVTGRIAEATAVETIVNVQPGIRAVKMKPACRMNLAKSLVKRLDTSAVKSVEAPAGNAQKAKPAFTVFVCVILCVMTHCVRRTDAALTVYATTSGCAVWTIDASTAQSVRIPVSQMNLNVVVCAAKAAGIVHPISNVSTENVQRC